MASCRNCVYYSFSYGLKDGKFVGSYISCDFNKKAEHECKTNNFTYFKQKGE